MAPVKPSCCNPGNKKNHVKAKSQKGVQAISNADRIRGIRFFPDFDWSVLHALHLCLSCRTYLIKKETNKKVSKGAGILAKKHSDRKTKSGTSVAGSNSDDIAPIPSTSTFIPNVSADPRPPTSSADAGQPSSSADPRQSTSSVDLGQSVSSVEQETEKSSDARLYPDLPEDDLMDFPIPSAPLAEEDDILEEIRPEIPAPAESDIVPSSVAQSSVESSTTSSGSVKSIEAQDALNKTLVAADISPARPSDKKKKGVMADKYDRVKGNLRKKIKKFSKGEVDPSPEVSKRRPCEYCKHLLKELAEKFKVRKNKYDKYKILTSIPKRFSIQEVMEATGCTAYEAREASQLKNENGAFSFLPPRVGRRLPQSTVDLVKKFYEDESRVSARSNDCVKIRDAEGEKKDIEKRRILHNLNDLYADFMHRHPRIKISISKFSLLRPKNCVWPGHSSYHNVCVCEIHQNFQFMMDALGIEDIMEDFLKSLVCGNEDCFLGLCSECPIQDKIEAAIGDLELEDEITYQKWIRTDSTEIRTLTVSTMEFKQEFKKFIPKIVEHDYITRRQNAFIYKLKNTTIKEEAAITITVDFAQNYSFVVQNAVQGFHWTNNQATVHPFVVHWWDLENNQLQYKSYCVISDILTHDANTFHLFRDKVMKIVKKDFEGIALSKVYYISDGAGSQYKNKKNMANLMNHKLDYDLDADWVFTSTGHGKSSSDAISAVCKCHTRRASLKGSLIITPEDMFKHCERNLTTSKLQFLHITKADLTVEFQHKLAERYKNYESLIGIRKHHLFQPMGQKMRMCRVANTRSFTDFDFQNAEVTNFNQSNVEIGNFYAVYEGNNYQAGMLVDVDTEEGEAVIQMMKIKRRTNELSWSEPINLMNIPYRQILCSISDPKSDPRNALGEQWIFEGDDLNKIKRTLKMYRQQMAS